MSDHVHVLLGEQGEYSDRRVWVVAVYRDQAEARDEAERLSAAWRQWYEPYCKAVESWPTEVLVESTGSE